VKTTTGKRMPLDARPVPGLFRIYGDTATHIADAYTSHFATCPDADFHRKA
jgi:hypothetical protein